MAVKLNHSGEDGIDGWVSPMAFVDVIIMYASNLILVLQISSSKRCHSDPVL